jgi:hypothetical protein
MERHTVEFSSRTATQPEVTVTRASLVSGGVQADKLARPHA